MCSLENVLEMLMGAHFNYGSKTGCLHLNNCFGVRVAVSAWSAGVGQHLKGLQMEKTPSRQKAYSVNRMKMARGTRE